MTTTARKLQLRFHGRVIDHLGIQMYQSPVAAIAELIANAWDADATRVSIELPRDDRLTYVIEDDGNGMSFRDCQDHYLNVGWCKREGGKEYSSLGRPFLGRKGIGKFAGFGIAQIMRVDTISKETGERTVFSLDINKLRSADYVAAGGDIDVEEYQPPDTRRAEKHGTRITLSNLQFRRPATVPFAKSMARRFLLHQRAADFAILVNNSPLPRAESLEKIQFEFPRAYSSEQLYAGLGIDEEGWGTESLPSGNSFRWKILFYEEPIEDEELRGIAVFARGKLAQAPFFFQLSGGLGGQHGQEYLSGQVQADFIDHLKTDVISTDRQSINWEFTETAELRDWGRGKIKELLRIWHDKRGAARAAELETKVAGFSARLDKLQPLESRTVKQALRKLAQVPTLNNDQFEQLGEAVLTAWEQGRLRNLIGNIAEIGNISEQELIALLLEAQALTALNIAEAVKTKLLTIGGLKLRIEQKQLELAVRDYIAQHPWLISPEWETFRVERSIKKLLDDVAKIAGLDGPEWAGRVDLALRSGSHLLLLEFMRPSLKADWDHVNRFERYVRLVRKRVQSNTAGPFREVTGYLVADYLEQTPDVVDKVASLAQESMFAMDWNMLFTNAISGWQEFLAALGDRAPEDERLKAVLSITADAK